MVRDRRLLTRWLTLSLAPPVVAAVVLLPLAGTDAPYFLLALLGLINAGMFTAAIMAWAFVTNRMDSIDDLLRPCAARDRVVGVVARALGPGRQARAVALFAALPLLLGVADGSLSRPGPTAVLVLATVTWSMALLGHVSYWLAVNPWLVVRLLRCGDVMLRWHDPARTPGIRALSEGYAYAACFLALGAFAVTVPGIAGWPVFGEYLPYLYGLLVAMSAWVAVLTQVGLYLVVRRFRLRMLDGLSATGDFQASAAQSVELVDRIRRLPSLSPTLSAYNSIATAPGLPYGSTLLAQYAAAVVGSGIGLLLQ